MTDNPSTDEVVEITDLLPLGIEIGSGLQGVVYELAGRSDVVLKRYRSGIVPDDEALDRLVRWRRDLPGPERATVDQRAAFPVARVVHDGNTAGVLLSAAPSHFRAQDGSLVSLAKLAGSALAVTRMARSLADLLSVLDRHHVTHGELSPESLLFSSDPPYVFVLDCDVGTIGPDRPALPRSTAPAWTDPRILAGEISRADHDSDRLMFGLAFLHAYFNVTSPASISSFPPVIPPSPPITHGVRSCLIGALQASAPREPIDGWVKALAELERQLADPISPLAQELASSATVFGADPLPDLAKLPPPLVEDPTTVLEHLPPPPADEPVTQPTALPPPPPEEFPASVALPTGLVEAFDGPIARSPDSPSDPSGADPRPTVRMLTVVVRALIALLSGFGAGFGITGLLT